MHQQGDFKKLITPGDFNLYFFFSLKLLQYHTSYNQLTVIQIKSLWMWISEISHWWFKCKKVFLFKTFQSELLSQVFKWYKADSQWLNLYLFFLSSLMPLGSKSRLYSNGILSLPTANMDGPARSTPPTNQSPLNPFNKWILTTSLWNSDAVKLLMIAQEDEHWQNIHEVVRVNTATEV